MVLPGAQALLGFQFVTLLLEDFARLPESMKQVHLLSLVLMTIAVVLLMTPAAYHRIVEHGENTERFHRFASRMLMVSLVPMAFGVRVMARPRAAPRGQVVPGRWPRVQGYPAGALAG